MEKKKAISPVEEQKAKKEQNTHLVDPQQLNAMIPEKANLGVKLNNHTYL
jgi:hypothetical protein